MSDELANLRTEVEAFAKEYIALWSNQQASLAEHAPELAKRVTERYRPGFTFFTNGSITQFQDRVTSAGLIESELRRAIAAGIGARMTLKDVRVEVLSGTSALCWLTIVFHPAATSGFQDWTFTNLYGYRARAGGSEHAGWEFVVRDQEANAIKQATGDVMDA